MWCFVSLFLVVNNGAIDCLERLVSEMNCYVSSRTLSNYTFHLCVCLSVSISLEPLDRSSLNFMCRSPVAVARTSSGSVAICYVLPVLWMMSCIAVVGVAIPGRWLHCVHTNKHEYSLQ